MRPLPSAILTCVFLISGGAATAIMMNRQGRPDSPPKPRQVVLHRIFGWAFVASFLVLFATMFGRFYSYWEEDPPRIVLHYTAAFALLLLLAAKIAIPRFYPGFRKLLFPLGFSVLVAGFLVASSALAHYIVRMTQKAPYISHSSFSAAPDLDLGKQLLIERCTICHLLDSILRPRPATAWENVVGAMAKLAWPRIRPDEAKQILFYLTATRVPPGPLGVSGFDAIDEHCLPCHRPEEILARPRTRKEWEDIVRRMSALSPDLVHAKDEVSILDALEAAQGTAPTKK